MLISTIYQNYLNSVTLTSFPPALPKLYIEDKSLNYTFLQLVGKEGWYSGIKLGRGAGDNSNDSNKIFDTKENVSFMNSNIHCSFVRNNSHVFL